MKKIAFLPFFALLVLASCSKDEDNVLPDYPVVVETPVADRVSIDVPKQNPGFVEEPGTSACYRFTYVNGQEIVFEVSTRIPGYVAFVKKIGGSASNVVIPYEIYATVGGEPATIPVAGFDLFSEAVTENVKTLTICSQARYVLALDNTTGAYSLVKASNDYLRQQLDKCPSVENVELDPEYPGLVSVKGSIYNSDFTELVAVPRGKTGLLNVVGGVTKIQDRAMANCISIDAITIPSSVTYIGKEAIMNTSSLRLINLLAKVAPIAYSDSFGYYAYNGTLRIPAGSASAYKFEKIEEPKEPAAPVDNPMATPEENDAAWDRYYEELEVYEEKLVEYDYYKEHAAYSNFLNIEEVEFTVE